MSRRKHKKKLKTEPPKTNGAASTMVDVDDVREAEETPGGMERDSETDDSDLDANEETGLAAVDPSPESSGSAEEELARELEAVKDIARRKQAEFENFRKRIERERLETIKYAAAGLMGEILPVLDNLERAIEASKAGGDADNFREGVEIIYRQFREILVKQGLEELEAVESAFDPHVHEAVGRVETTDHPDGTVLEVFLKGYRFKDKLLRPAMVNVAIGADNDDSSDGEDEEQDS